MNENKNSFFIEVFKFSLLTLFIVLPFRMFVAKPFVVSGASMSPTFETGNYLIVDQLSYHFEKPNREAIIVFKYPKDPSRYFIKRIIGLPGETVIIKNDKITIKKNKNDKGFELKEDFIKKPTEGSLTYKLTDDEYFVMGDNRTNSSDSRVWGAVEKNLIIGRVLVRLFPLNKVDLFPGNFVYQIKPTN